MNIRNKIYIAVHGDYDKYSNTGVSNLCMYLGFIPYAITYGHLHTCAIDESNGVKMIRGGSLAGSGDDYTINFAWTDNVHDADDVGAISSDGWLEIFGLYSATTRKHIGAFVKEYVIFPNGTHGDYQFAKKIYNDNYRFNIATGEVVER